VSMGDLAASGGYYIAAPADEIWASPATITGSIGIFAAFPTVNRALDKVGVSSDGLGTAPLSGALRLDRPVSAEASRFLQATIQRGYEDFLARVGDGRKRSREQIDAVAQGRVWAGRDAVKAGLVDQLGSLDEAVASAAKRAGITDGKFDVDYLEPELSWAQQLALSIEAPFARALGGAVGRTLGKTEGPLVGGLSALAGQPLARELARWARMSSTHRVYAYCFCSVN
jgi:protease IV